nr:unnamed protein product [Digitaria exilis]
MLIHRHRSQRGNARTVAAIAAFPVVVCALLAAMQHVVDSELGRPPFRCPAQALTCAAREPPGWPALVQVPGNEARALTPLHPWRCDDASSEEENNNCPAAVLITGRKRQLAERLGRGLFPRVPAEYYLGTDDASDTPDYFEMFSRVVPGSSSLPAHVLFMEPGLAPNETLYVLQDLCLWNSSRVSGMSDGMPFQYGLDIFILNNYRIQFIFYFTYINLQIALAFLFASFFSSVRAASVIGYIYVFGSGLLGDALLLHFIEDTTFPKHWLVKMQLFPAFSLYRGIYDLAGYAYAGRNMGKPANNSSRRVPDTAKPDVFLECKVVKQLLEKTNMRSMIICNNLKKVYAGKNGNPDKIAVRGLSLALYRGQCFGMLGPSGSGKTSFINMMIGLVMPTNGTAYIDGMDLRKDMNEIYACIGVCPQHEYGDKLLVQHYSLKVNFSVVVYMDELSTGLDPMSRNDLWNVIKKAKKDCTIILTSTHSMDEADELCDRIGIFVDGEFNCLGTPNELKARYSSTRTLTIMTDPKHKGKVEKLMNKLSPSIYRFYSVSGTQKFILPRWEVGLYDVFRVIETLRHSFPVLGWGLADATLEDVFIRVVKDAQVFYDMGQEG